MITDKTFSHEEFHSKVREFAQEFANRIGPNARIALASRNPFSYDVIIEKTNGKEIYNISLTNSGKVVSESVYEV